MLFLQGTRDTLADLTMLKPMVRRPRQARHAQACSTKPTIRSMCRRAPAARIPRSGSEMLDAFAAWMEKVLG